MANPDELTDEEIDKKVEEVRNHQASGLSPMLKAGFLGWWVPYLLVKIDQLEKKIKELDNG